METDSCSSEKALPIAYSRKKYKTFIEGIDDFIRRTSDPAAHRKRKAIGRIATIPERMLWNRLRGGNLAGLKFRRQQPLGPYIVDFFCHEAGLVVEVDGRSHDGRGGGRFPARGFPPRATATSGASGQQ